MLNKELTVKWYKGLNEYGKFTENERKKTLPQLTVEESYRQYLSLYSMWDQMRKQQKNINLLNKLEIDFLVHRRRIFDKLAGKIK
ncbi:MAG: hypothetical protein ISS28_02960 [Candidatus Cloacimonetes bacterium]|nr:hypothetical protein [Candidatus Cloacimonadota bacterium]